MTFIKNSALPTILLILLICSIASARKVKRKGVYLNHHPPRHIPTQPATSPSAPPEPYQFEELHYEDYANTQHQGISGPVQHHYNDHEYYGVQEHQPSISSSSSSSSSGTYLIDNGLRSIAKGSADQANSAVASQNAAGKQAAYVAKSTLAQAATQAAGTAVAVLKGKEVLLKRLEEQNVEAHKSMQSELQQLQQAKRAAKAAQYSAQQALNHVSVLTAALNNAQAASELAQKSASEAAAELASQIDMVASAKSKLEQIETHLYTARLDYEETKDAAEKATLSAQEAQLNANDAGLHANVELSESSASSDHHYGHAEDKSDNASDTTQWQPRRNAGNGSVNNGGAAAKVSSSSANVGNENHNKKKVKK